MDKNTIQLHFGGESHSIDANTLLNTLIHCNNLLTFINAEYGGGAKEIKIQVNAPQKGSFILDLSVVENALRSIFSKDSVEYVGAVIGILGTVYTVYKEFKGRPADRVTIEQNTALNIDAKILINVVNIYNDRRCREAVSKSFETLNGDESIDSFELITEKSVISIPREDFTELIYNDFDNEEEAAEEITSEEDATLVIISLNFEKGATWSFIHKGNRFRMNVKDDALMEQIDKGMQFGKGDAIRVKLQYRKRYNPEYRVYEIVSRRIVEFYELIKRDYKNPRLIDEQ